MMPGCSDSTSDSDFDIVSSTVQRRSHRKILLSDSESDTPQAAHMQRSAGAIGQHVPSTQPGPTGHAKRPTSAERQISPTSGHQRALSFAAAARLPSPHRAHPAAAQELAACSTGLRLDASAALPTQPQSGTNKPFVPWPDATSPRVSTAVTSADGSDVAKALPSVTASCRSISDGTSSGCLTFSRSVRRGGQRLELSDSESEHATSSMAMEASSAARSAATAMPAQAVRRLSFAGPESPTIPPNSKQPAQASQHKASVRWADAQPPLPAASLWTALQGLQLDDQPAPPDGIVDLCTSPQAEQQSSPGSPEIAWAATYTPRRRLAVLSDDAESDSDPAVVVHPAAGYASPPSGVASPSASSESLTACEFLPTPWRCTPPWQFPATRPQPRATPATAPARRQPAQLTASPATPAAAMPSAVRSPAEPGQAATPPWMSGYKRPAEPPQPATRRNLAAVEAAAKPAAPRPRRASVLPPPDIITLSSDEEAEHSVFDTPDRDLLVPTDWGQENEGPAAIGTPARPLQPRNFSTAKTAPRPAGRGSAITGQKPTGQGAKVPFARQREALAESLYRQYNAKVFGGQLPADLQITWSKTLCTTAGLTHYSRTAPAQGGGSWKYVARVELSAKVVDRLERLEATLAHELCHAACWVLNHSAKPPHGQAFYGWAAKFGPHFPHVQITTRHSYEIQYAFRWQCTNAACGKVYGRHSNSLDVSKKVCGRCRARLQPLGRFRADGTPARARVASAFSLFVKENFAAAKAAAGAHTPHRDVMKAVAVLWKQQKQLGQAPEVATTTAIA